MEDRPARATAGDEEVNDGVQSAVAIELSGAADRITKAGLLDNVVTAARALKAAESAYRDAQQAYGEAVKQLSEEAVK